MRTSKGPLAWHAGQEAGLTTSLMFWKNGPSVKPQRRQSYLTCCSCGKTPDRRVTTPVSRTSWFRWNCLQHTGCLMQLILSRTLRLPAWRSRLHRRESNLL